MKTLVEAGVCQAATLPLFWVTLGLDPMVQATRDGKARETLPPRPTPTLLTRIVRNAFAPGGRI
ncbi:hypothetical protein AZF01_06270 [Martelella sp. AD-3]|nr:hypothetical protein AZF01_06270 [Martelella sp. AD-3]